MPNSYKKVACEQAPGGASAEQTFGANVCSALAPPGACSQANKKAAIVTSLSKQQEFHHL